jgi:hypothetical protein
MNGTSGRVESTAFLLELPDPVSILAIRPSVGGSDDCDNRIGAGFLQRSDRLA